VDGMNRTDGELYQIHQWWLEGILHIVICALGFFTNLISIRVLLSSEMKNLFNITLAILAIFDAVYNFCDIAESFRIVHYEQNPCADMPLYQKIHLNIFPHVLRPLRYISMVASIYTTIIISMERYVAVSKPIYSFVGYFEGAHGKWRSALMYTIPAALFSFAFSLPKFFEFSVASKDFLCNENTPIHQLDSSTPHHLLTLARKGKASKSILCHKSMFFLCKDRYIFCWLYLLIKLYNTGLIFSFTVLLSYLFFGKYNTIESYNGLITTQRIVFMGDIYH
jgi:hypothetical protein